MIPQVDPQKAHDLMQSGNVYLDVRTVEEYAAGHPQGAVNIPAFVRDAMGQMAPNPEFLSVVQANFAPGAELVLGCGSGGRSQSACELLAASGYTSVANVAGGFSGKKDPFGRVVAPGWLQCGLPVAQGDDPAMGYAALRARAAEKA
jgi:rhodanese-related sulfurtransferase